MAPDIGASAVLDWLTSVDDKLDVTNDYLEAIHGQLDEQATSIDELTNATAAVATALGEDVDIGGGSEFPWELSATVPADTGRHDPFTTETEIDYDATINTAILGFPTGTQQSVGVKVGTKIGSRWIPRGGVEQDATGSDAEYVAFDGTVIPIDLNIDIDAGVPVQAEFVNNDAENDHFINVLLLAEER